jgi:hypothetical protein
VTKSEIAFLPTVRILARMEIKVDGRVELISILFHLAGGKGYIAYDTPYRRAVDAWFAPHVNHPAVIASRELHDQHGISFNAPVGLAVFLDTRTLLPIADLQKAEELDSRWKGAPVRDYLEKVRAFAGAANIHGFFQQEQPYINEVQKRMAAALANEKLDEWFQKTVVRDRPAEFVVVPGLLTGTWNYDAASHDSAGRQFVYQVVELEGVDAQGLPTPTRLTTELVAHEMAHSYVNPVVERHADVLVQAAQPLYDREKAMMEKQRYPSPRIMVEESIVRALAVFCTRDRVGPQSASELVHKDMAMGFYWLIDLCTWIAQQKSPLDLEKLVPGIAKFFADEATKPAPTPVAPAKTA